ncbi:hypothetical protein ACB098_06G065800 [Castanea mollissima]
MDRIPQSSSTPAASAAPSFQYTVTIDLPNSVLVCIIVTLFFISLYIFVIAIIFINRDHDLEEGQGVHRQPDNTGSSQSHQSPFYQAIDRHNVWVSGILERLMCDIDRKRGERLRASQKLPPLVNYGSDDISSSSSSTVTDCAICLEDFVVGDSCQVFPVCDHIFHSYCIDHWLKTKLSCPICRRSIIDV